MIGFEPHLGPPDYGWVDEVDRLKKHLGKQEVELKRLKKRRTLNQRRIGNSNLDQRRVRDIEAFGTVVNTVSVPLFGTCREIVLKVFL